MLLYPYHPELESRGLLTRHRVNVPGSDQRLLIASVDVAADRIDTIAALKEIALSELELSL
jgi:hypothetical protein